MRQPDHRQEGFTLPLVAAMLLVAAMIAASVLQKSNRDEFWNPKVETQKRLQHITDLLVAYQRNNGRLPCPASRLLAYNNVNEGVERTTSGNACTGSDTSNPSGTVYISSNANMVRIGTVPFKTLGLPREYGEDAWGNKLIYAVTAYYTSTANFQAATGNSNGRVRIDTYHRTNPTNAGASFTLSNRAAFVLISPGPDGKGAFKANSTATAAPIACGSTGAAGDGRDSENCNANATFFTGSLTMPAGPQHYDDQLVWREVDAAALDTWAP